jgi:hypothetical protein
MNKDVTRLVEFLARYNVTATEYLAHLTKKGIVPHGQPFKTALQYIIENLEAAPVVVA